MDARTPEQRAADEDLQTAIERVTRAYGSVYPNSVVTTWVVTGLAVGADEQGDIYSDFLIIPNNGQAIPGATLIGLLRTAQLRVETAFTG